MNEIGWIIVFICVLLVVIVVLYNRRKTQNTMQAIENMLDNAINGTFSETAFDESKLSALETKFAHYLSSSETSSKKVAQEKDRIKSLIADISHQTKTPIANLMLYSELLLEDELPESSRTNAEAVHQQSEKLCILIGALRRGNKPHINQGKIKSFSKRKLPSIIGVCLATHYLRYKEEFHNDNK